MKKIIYLIFCSLTISSCSNNSDTINKGHGFISFKVDGVLYQYTIVKVGEAIKQQNQDYVKLNIGGYGNLKDGFYHDQFGITIFRGGQKNNTAIGGCFTIRGPYASNEATYDTSYGLPPLTCNFITNSETRVNCTFEGTLKKDYVGEIKITEGKIDIEYGTSNYGHVPYD